MSLLNRLMLKTVPALGVDDVLRWPLGMLADAAGRWLNADVPDVGRAEREQANAAAHKMAAVLASTTDGVFEVDPDWRITFMNDRARMLIAEGRDVVGKRLWDAFPDAVDSVFSREYDRALAEQEPVEFEGYYPRLDAWFAVRAFPSQGGLAVFFQDVTARKRSDAALLAANREKCELLAHHDAMLAHAPVGFAFFDRERRCIRVNEELARLNGLPVDAHAGRPLDEVLPGNAMVMGPILDRVFATGEAVQTREIVGEVSPSAGGGRRHWLTNIYPVKEDGAVTAVGVVVMEITDLRDAEAARRQSDERARSVFAQAAVGIERVALDGRILEANGKACAILGYTAEEIAGRSFRELTHPADRAAEEALLDRLLVGDVPSYALEKRCIRKDGSMVLVRVTSSLARITGTEAAYRIAIVEDITERKHAEEALKDSQERLRLALSSAEAGTWEWDIASNTSRWSAESYALFGLEPNGSAPKRETWLAVIVPEDRAIADACLHDTLANRRTEFHTEYRVNHPKRGLRWLAAIGRAIYADDGTPVRMTGINLDITGRKEMEQALHRAKEEAERANLAKTKFLAAASHDLRQPLQSLFFFTAALEAQVSSPKGAEVLRHLERGLDALKGLLDSLLDVSRLDAGLVTADVEDFAVSDVLDEIATAYAPVANAKGLLWRVTPCHSVVRSDRTLLSRMVRNLIENALRYTAEGAVALDCRSDGEALHITVRDTGIGIPPDQLERIWEEFHQVGNPERDRAQGLGLGLAIVRRLSALLDHPVEVRSTVGAGAEFRIRVPLGTVAAKPAATPGGPVASGAGRFAVLVDDDAIVLMGLQAILKEWGYEVLAAGSADQAVEGLAADGRTPDIIVADYRLREGRVGTEAILRVRALHGAGIPGIILTGETGPECQHDAAEHHFCVVHKPVTPRELGAALERQMLAAE
ncbi:PAS domain S-box protein [Azospirillum sp. sgz301742]